MGKSKRMDILRQLASASLESCSCTISQHDVRRDIRLSVNLSHNAASAEMSTSIRFYLTATDSLLAKSISSILSVYPGTMDSSVIPRAKRLLRLHLTPESVICKHTISRLRLLFPGNCPGRNPFAMLPKLTVLRPAGRRFAYTLAHVRGKA
jgi:hypothetical protein